MEWEAVIGLEVHVSLSTNTKLFSGTASIFGAEPNTEANIFDLAMPGTLPVLNKEALRMAVKFGLAIDAEIGKRSVFDRKNYFYPDLPKGYQVTQLNFPTVGKGSLTITLEDGSERQIGVTRRTSKRMPASPCMKISTACQVLISTARENRCWKLCRSQKSEMPKRL